jgi:UDP-GlcNAc:undecaprenyl-phosphate GlcNAc-1-phosphate transferase
LNTNLVYPVLFSISLGISLVLTGRSIHWAKRWGVLDEPGERKVHEQTKPRLGGLGIFGGFFLTLIGAVAAAQFVPSSLFPESVGDFLRGHRSGILAKSPAFLGMVAAGVVMFLGGLLDDRKNLPPRIKLLWQLAASGILIASGFQLDFYKVVWNHPMGFWLIGVPVTLFWMLFLINAFNLLDNMDGLSAGVAAITTSFFAVYAHLQGEFFLAASMSCLVGALVGFLRYNWNPSRIFMGDGGALLVGLLIAAFSCQCTYYRTEQGFWSFFARFSESQAEQGIISLLTPLVIMAVPIFDTTTVVLIRLLHRKPIMVGDTNHFSHRLVALGLSHKHAVLVIYLLTAFTGLGALILRTPNLDQALFVFLQVLSVFGMISVLEWGHRRGKGGD